VVPVAIPSEDQKKDEARGEVPEKNPDQQIPKALSLALISIGAALYAVAKAVTSFIPTPWGIGQFAPGVVVPAFFSVVFGPFIGGIGAAIGCFLGDFALSFFGLTTPILSLVAGVPGNLVGFYVLGWLVARHRSLSSFVLSSFVALVVGNLVAALGVLAYFVFIVPEWTSWPINLQVSVVAGLTLFWLSTMVVFVVPLVPVLVKYIEPTLSKIGVKGVLDLEPGSRADMIRSTSLVTIILVTVYVVVSFIPGGAQLFAGQIPPELLLLCAGVILVAGLVFEVLSEKLIMNMSRKI
jgi:uncharacterized membrane protein